MSNEIVPVPRAEYDALVRDSDRYRLFKKIVYEDRDESFDAYDQEGMDAELDLRLARIDTERMSAGFGEALALTKKATRK